LRDIVLDDLRDADRLSDLEGLFHALIRFHFMLCREAVEHRMRGGQVLVENVGTLVERPLDRLPIRLGMTIAAGIEFYAQTRGSRK